MDGSRFDGITRALATGQTRRHALRGAAGSAVARLLGLAGVEDVAAARVKPGKKGRDGPKNKKCCDGDKCVNLRNDKKDRGRCNKKCEGVRGEHKCKNSKCRSKPGCKVGQNIRGDSPTVPNDPRICGGDLVESVRVCVTDVEGTARCSDLVGGTCSDCTSNADRDPGFVRIDGRGTNCNCELQPESNGNARVQGNCNGPTGSSVDRGRTRLTTPLLRQDRVARDHGTTMGRRRPVPTRLVDDSMTRAGRAGRGGEPPGLIRTVWAWSHAARDVISPRLPNCTDHHNPMLQFLYLYR